MRENTSRVATHRFVIVSLILLIGSWVGAEPFGVNAHIPNDEVVEKIHAAGIEWVRIDFLWSRVESERDIYTWKQYDALMERLESRGLRAYATIQGTPAWATSGPEFSGVPDDVRQWQEFVFLAATRYRGRIAAWGIWNEPNISRFWDGTRSEYINILLIPGSVAVRAADPEALVCGPDLAHLSSAHWQDWMRQVIKHAGDFIDVLTHHYYPSRGKASELAFDFNQKPEFFWGPPSVRDVLKDTGWWGRPFWLTETGVQSHIEGPGDQADYIEDIVGDWFGQSPEGRWVDQIFVYQMHDSPAPPESTFGLLHGKPELIPKPAFEAYRTAIDSVRVDDAEVIENSAPAFIAPAETLEFHVILRNTGTTVWSSAEAFGLDVKSDSDIWTTSVSPLDHDFVASPGELASFLVRITAPISAGIFSPVSNLVHARMRAGNGRLFGDPIRAKLSATHDSPPTLQNHPRSITAVEGRRARFSIHVDSDTPVRYQWRRNSVELAESERIRGSRSRHLKLLGIDRSDEGHYDCVVTNSAGTVTTHTAELSIRGTGTRKSSGRLSNRQLAVTETHGAVDR